MGKVKELLKKAHLNKLYWDVMTKPPMSVIRHEGHQVVKDFLLNQYLPDAYDHRRNLPVNERKVVFVETRVSSLSDNFTLLYDELTKRYNFTVHVHCLKEISVSKPEYLRNCRKMLADIATAKYVFLNDASNVVSCIDKRPETIITQLWHACGAFKRFGLSTADHLFGLDEKDTRRHPFYANLNYVTVSSPEIVWAYAEAMDLKGKEETIVATGVSRTDIFYQEEFHQAAREHLYEVFPAAKGKKVILFAPTFRGRVAVAQTADQFDPEIFYRDLREDYVVVTKHHPYVKKLPVLPEHLKDTFIYDATHTLSIEELLCVSDICISDYSSLIYEYSLLSRPMLFFAYDLEDYFDWRGFYYNYEELTPGPVCRTNEEMTEYILHVDERFDPKQVEAFRERFMSACDGHATQRIMDLVFGQETLDRMRRS